MIFLCNANNDNLLQIIMKMFVNDNDDLQMIIIIANGRYKQQMLMQNFSQ